MELLKKIGKGCGIGFFGFMTLIALFAMHSIAGGILFLLGALLFSPLATKLTDILPNKINGTIVVGVLAFVFMIAGACISSTDYQKHGGSQETAAEETITFDLPDHKVINILQEPHTKLIFQGISCTFLSRIHGMLKLNLRMQIGIQFIRFLHNEHRFIIGNLIKNDIKKRRFPGSTPARYQKAISGKDSVPDIVCHPLIQHSFIYQLFPGMLFLGQFSDMDILMPGGCDHPRLAVYTKVKSICSLPVAHMQKAVFLPPSQLLDQEHPFKP